MDITNYLGTILFSAAVESLKDLVVAAVKNGANLYGANLYGADLSGADLRDANLCGAHLCGANLRDANLCGAHLRDADLRGANLRGAHLRDANLYGANLRGAHLRDANLYGANLCGANLRDANLCGAHLRGAHLRGAHLRDADLRGANLYGANLRGANLRGALNIPELAAAQTNILPEGNIIGWKQCQGGVIVKLLIGQKVRRSNASNRKCRAESAKVLAVFGAEIGISQHDGKTQYRKDATVICDSWNEDRWTECGGGIHFYITRAEAENQ